VHNPLIRKNGSLLPALHLLNKRGIRLLLQNHDMAEDFRPDMYIPRQDYPENCHYAVINSRDYSFLHRAGLSPQGLHLLPNEVSLREPGKCAEGGGYLYPVRAIRRKNIGEVLFLACFIPRERPITVTLPPGPGKDERIYRFWKDLAREFNLPLIFEAGLSRSLDELYRGAAGVVTTSVKEGFGFSYLEPWTAGRAVLGRRIDYVCRDFEENGIQFDPPGQAGSSLYPGISIPVEYISLPVLRKKTQQALTGIYGAYGLEAPGHLIKMIEEHDLEDGMVDFGCLDEELQEGILRILLSNEAVFREISGANPFLAGLASWKGDEELIASNREAVKKAYGRERITGILRDCYRSVIAGPAVQKLSKSMLLELYLDPLRFFAAGVGYE
jgi:hypothetical protein